MGLEQVVFTVKLLGYVRRRVWYSLVFIQMYSVLISGIHCVHASITEFVTLHLGKVVRILYS